MQTHLSLLEVPKSSRTLQTRMRRNTDLASVIMADILPIRRKTLSNQSINNADLIQWRRK